VIYACLESGLIGEPVLVADILSGRRHAYEDSVWEANARIKAEAMNKLT
jgi:hypothetical protein